ncbi:MAG TPA: choice-of-anchor P family protein [Acidimicrobiales bacterium]|nr:choice-of-anchor P family protein [Acidimicrobiales bacterium]
MRTLLRERRYTPATVRVGLACAIAAAVCIVELGGSTSGADTSFVPGNAVAQSQAISLAPTTGGLNYAITLATSISNYQDMEAQSLSQTIDLGAIGTALEAQGCDGGNPTLPQSDVPPPVQVESTSGNQSQTNSITPQSSPDGLGIGNEQASATTQPTSDATTTVQNISVPGGLVSINGLTSTTHASLDNNATRTATATADIKQLSLGGGAVVLGGLHWAATQQTGGATAATGTFSVGSLSVNGTPVDLSAVGSALSPQTVFNLINTALTPVGINIQWPTQTTLDDGTVQISPLVIGIDNNELGQQVIGANQNGVQPVREALVNALLSANCNFATPILVGDIGVGVLAGGGNLNLDLGGASAMTNALAASSPFGPGSSALPPTSALSSGNAGNSGSALGGSALTAGSGFAGNSGTGSLTQGSAGSGGSATTPTTGASTSALGPIQKTSDCISLGPAGGGCSTGNVAVPVGLLGLALVVGLFTWDYLRQRRRMPLHRVEVSS